eukprot:14278482-Ditylum_brightwellii.AAC.1
MPDIESDKAGKEKETNIPAQIQKLINNRKLLINPWDSVEYKLLFGLGDDDDIPDVIKVIFNMLEVGMNSQYEDAVLGFKKEDNIKMAP